MIVAMIGFTSYFALRKPAMRAKAPPATRPTTMRMGIIATEGRLKLARDKPTTATKVPPKTIWPYPPILKNFIAKGIVNA